MDITFHVTQGFVARFTASDIKEAFRIRAELEEIFSEAACGVCGSTNIRCVFRTARTPKGDFPYYEYACSEPQCGARLSFGQAQQGGALFPKRRLDHNGAPDMAQGHYGAHNGWTRYRGQDDGSAPSPADEYGYAGGAATQHQQAVATQQPAARRGGSPPPQTRTGGTAAPAPAAPAVSPVAARHAALNAGIKAFIAAARSQDADILSVSGKVDEDKCRTLFGQISGYLEASEKAPLREDEPESWAEAANWLEQYTAHVTMMSDLTDPFAE